MKRNQNQQTKAEETNRIDSTKSSDKPVRDTVKQHSNIGVELSHMEQVHPEPRTDVQEKASEINDNSAVKQTTVDGRSETTNEVKSDSEHREVDKRDSEKGELLSDEPELSKNGKFVH